VVAFGKGGGGVALGGSGWGDCRLTVWVWEDFGFLLCLRGCGECCMAGLDRDRDRARAPQEGREKGHKGTL